MHWTDTKTNPFNHHFYPTRSVQWCLFPQTPRPLREIILDARAASSWLRPITHSHREPLHVWLRSPSPRPRLRGAALLSTGIMHPEESTMTHRHTSSFPTCNI